MPRTALIPFLTGAQAVVAGLETYDESVFQACPEVRHVARIGVGYENVHLAEATRSGVVVTITPGANSTSVAELALGLLIAVSRHIVPTHEDLQAGTWKRRQGTELAGKTLGIVGLGHVGRVLATLALGLNMRVVANDIAPDHAFAAAHGIPFLELSALLALSDAVSFHVPLTDLTRSMLSERTLGQLKPGAIVINTSRGGVVDVAALVRALDDGRVGGAALDVHAEEGRVDPALLARPNVIVTPHIGASTRESLRRMAEHAVRNVLAWLDGTLIGGALADGVLNPEALL